MNPLLVSIVQDSQPGRYPAVPPFSPTLNFPEYPFGENALESGHDPAAGRTYEMVRQVLFQLQMDLENYGTRSWNPLGELIHPGDTVLLKPNIVCDRHGWGWDIQSVITHGSVVRAILDYVYIALKHNGKIIIGDAPIQLTDFAKAVQTTGLASVIRFYQAQAPDIDIELIDFRQSIASQTPDGIITQAQTQVGSPEGSTAVRLNENSWLAPISDGFERFRVTNYVPGKMKEHHNLLVNEYLISNSVLRANVVINLPKMKTHRKAGLTAALKNLVGINAHKDWLPHHRVGAVNQGGDEYEHANILKQWNSVLLDKQNSTHKLLPKRLFNYSARLVGKIARIFARDPYTEGSWHGNDTVWRMALDLNRILLYASSDGSMQPQTQRKVFNLVDGIIAGEGEGPLEPTAKNVGILVAGINPVAVDAVLARLMGFDYRKIPLIYNGFNDKLFPLIPFAAKEIVVISSNKRWKNFSLISGTDSLGFEPASGWKGHIEL